MVHFAIKKVQPFRNPSQNIVLHGGNKVLGLLWLFFYGIPDCCAVERH